MKIQTPKSLDQMPAAPDLDPGEKEVLALGIQYPGCVLILDERLARRHAEALKLDFTGTLGILLRAKAEKRIQRIEPLLQRLDGLGFRLSARTRAAVLKQAGESSE